MYGGNIGACCVCMPENSPPKTEGGAAGGAAGGAPGGAPDQPVADCGADAGGSVVSGGGGIAGGGGVGCNVGINGGSSVGAACNDGSGNSIGNKGRGATALGIGGGGGGNGGWTTRGRGIGGGGGIVGSGVGYNAPGDTAAFHSASSCATSRGDLYSTSHAHSHGSSSPAGGVSFLSDPPPYKANVATNCATGSFGPLLSSSSSESAGQGTAWVIGFARKTNSLPFPEGVCASKVRSHLSSGAQGISIVIRFGINGLQVNMQKRS
mmetsp:Transcript_29999/g.86336  ORF Transcript_29999/g.86336 Transcript_29999/m.86336 type:complete len:265 (-) Transcript_29999:497-1291(-)